MDPTTAPFWEAATRHELLVQRCDECGSHQFYPRPFCLRCDSEHVRWVPSSGRGRIYSKTIVRAPLAAGFVPPYAVAIIELAEGPRMLAEVDPMDCNIDDEVVVDWREREGKAPLPVFTAVRPGRS